MARNSRRSKSSATSFSPLMKLFLIVAVIVVSATFLTFQKYGVLGTSDHVNTTTVTSGKVTPTPGSTCKFPRVNVITLSIPCDPNTRTGFRKAEFKCSDGHLGTVSKGCMNVSEALGYANQICYKYNTCNTRPTPTPHAPTPTRSEPTPTSHL